MLAEIISPVVPPVWFASRRRAGAMAAAEQAWPAPPPFRRRDPPAPVEGEFSMYGVTRSTGPPVAPPLEEQVYDASAADVRAELRELNRSLLQSFLELTQLMARSPSQCCDKGARPPATHPHAPPRHLSHPRPCHPRSCRPADALPQLPAPAQHLPTARGARGAHRHRAAAGGSQAAAE